MASGNVKSVTLNKYAYFCKLQVLAFKQEGSMTFESILSLQVSAVLCIDDHRTIVITSSKFTEIK
jgi:hypothetical protein